MTRPLQCLVLAALLELACVACSDDASTRSDASDSTTDVAAKDSTHLDAAESDATPADTDPGADTANADAVTIDSDVDDASPPDASDAATPIPDQEAEPNSGTPVEQVNAIRTGIPMLGAIGEPDDVDVFQLASTPGEVVVVTLDAPAGSSLQPHLTVIDGGRGTKQPGEDFVKIAVGTPSARLAFLAMGTGGHYLIVRDARNLGGSGQGGPGHGYALTAAARAPADFVVASPSFPATVTETLAYPGDLHLVAFSASEGTNLVADLQAETGSGLDGRLFVVAETHQDWIARNDDRSAGDPNPRIDAPLYASGAMLLVIENIEPTAATGGYTLRLSTP